MINQKNITVFASLMAIVVALCWGFNFAASKFSLLHFPPFFVIFIRYVLVTLLLLPFARKSKFSFKQLFILSLLMITIHFTFVFSAIAMGLELSTTVIVIQMGAPFSCVLGAIFLKDMLGPWRTTGMAIAFMGVVVIAGTPAVGSNWIAFVLAIIGAMAWAGSNVYMKVLGQESIMPLLFWTGLLSLPQTLLVSLILEDNHIDLLLNVPTNAAVAILYSAIASTIIGYGLWYWLLKNFSVSQVTPYSLLTPIGGILSGVIFFQETLTNQMMVGGFITICGVAIITLRRPRLARLDRG